VAAERSWGRSLALVLAHPSLWITALRQAGRLAPDGWWRRPPFLPLPDREYLRFRLETQYGTSSSTSGAPSAAPDPDDVVTYLRWCREQQALRRRDAGTRGGAVRSRR
jgi:hypothetical protein